MRVRANNASGGGGISDYTVSANTSDYGKTHTISNKKGSKLLILLCDWASSHIPYNRFDGATASGGTITEKGNFTPSSTYVSGTWYLAEVTSDTFTITHTVNNVMEVIEAV